MKKYLSASLVLVLLLTLLTGCGASSSAPAMDAAMPEAPAMKEEAVQMDNSLTGAGSTGSAAIPENRKWIITVDMSAETENLDALLDSLDGTIASLKGFVEGQNIYNGSSYSSRRYRSASMIVRIPAESVDQFTQAVSGVANVVRSNKNLEDVTLSYTSTESRIQALKTEEARLLDFMAKAEDMADLLQIEDRLTDVQYELERHASQLRLYDNQIDYATIYLDIEEVQEYTPVVEKTTWERIRDGFMASVKGLGNGVKEVFVWVLVNSPYLVVFGVLGFGVFAVIKHRKIRKAAKKSKSAPAAEPDRNENE